MPEPDDNTSHMDRLKGITETEPVMVLSAQMLIIIDQCVAQGVRNYRRGRGKDLRAMGFTETADVLDM